MNTHDTDSLLTRTAKAIGSVAGKFAAQVGAGERAEAPKRIDGKLTKKHKSRLPRKQKKAVQKAMLATNQN